MITKIRTLGELPPPVRAIAAQVNKMSDQFAHLTDGKISTKAIPDIYRMGNKDQLMQKAREIDAEIQPVLDIERAKDSKGKTRHGAGHLRKAYIVAIRLIYDPIDEVTGEEHYNTEMYYCEVKDIHELEKLDAERKEIEDAERKERQRKREQHEAVRIATRERRKRLRSSRN